PPRHAGARPRRPLRRRRLAAGPPHLPRPRTARQLPVGSPRPRTPGLHQIPSGNGRLPVLPGQPHRSAESPAGRRAAGADPPPAILPLQRRPAAEVTAFPFNKRLRLSDRCPSSKDLAMNSHLVRGLFAAAALLTMVTAVDADEGMWLFNHPPLKHLKDRYGFTPDQKWLDHVRLSSVRFNSGGSGSLVSADRLVMTNHHVGPDTLQKLRTPEKNYTRD